MHSSLLALAKDQAYALWFAYPTGLREWPPLCALREWRFDELQRCERWLRSQGEDGTAPKAGPARRH